MKVFISWSGNRSKAVAELLAEWIRCVIQATRPWISTSDIDRGALWFSEINDQLKDASVGIVCLTQENKDRPWILFESGALAKGLSSNRVCTFLIDLTHADVAPPLSMFNHTLPERGSVLALVRTLNRGLGNGGLDEGILTNAFDTYWDQFQTKFASLLEEHPAAVAASPRPDEDLLAEILEGTRSTQSRLRSLEDRLATVSPREVAGDDYNPLLIERAYRIALPECRKRTFPPEIFDQLVRDGYPANIANEAIGRAREFVRCERKMNKYSG